MKKRWIQRGIAWILLAVLLTVSQPVYAWDVQPGEKCESVYGTIYVGSDGKAYYSEPTERYLLYNKDGTTSKHTMAAGYARQWFYMMNTDGEMQKVFCIEAGVDFKEAKTGYVVSGGEDSAYMNRLPDSARKGIALTLLFGWQKGRELPVSGINEDDYALATQVLLWEYQQQLRVDTGKRRSNGWAEADQFFSNIENRPAEKAYNWILEQIQQHTVLPSFAAATIAEAKTYTMKYDPENEEYTVTLEDSNGTLADLKWDTQNGIRLKRDGDRYTFISEKPLTAATLKLQKKTAYKGQGLFIWGMPGYQTMVSGAQDSQYFYMRLKTEEDGSLRLIKKSEDDQIEGIRFLIEGNGQQQTVATGKDGTLKAENLKPGSYTVTELNQGKYIPLEAQKVQIQSGMVSEVIFTNKMKRGSLQVIKTSEDGKSKNMEFRLYGESAYGTFIDRKEKTNASGIAVFENIPISGKEPYTIEEIGTADRYVVPEAQRVTITWKKKTEVSFYNELKKFQLDVQKKDHQQDTASGDATLAGAQYGIYRNGELIDVYTTDANGQFTTMEYECGEGWTLRELQPSAGYLLDTAEYPVSAEPGLHDLKLNRIPIEVKEEVIQGKIQLIKQTEAPGGDSGVIEAPEAGAVFQVYLQSAGSYETAKDTEKVLLTTDSNGYAVSGFLPYGCYVVHQVSGKEGHALVPDFTVLISEHEKTYSFILNNRILTSNVRIEKRDAETGKLIAVSGIGFQILDKAGNWMQQHIQEPERITVDTFYTNEEGWLMLPEPLPYGEYALLEVQAPDGYIKDDEPVYFSVDGSMEEIVVVKENMAKKGKIQIEKWGEVYASVVEKEDLSKPVFKMQKMAGVEFTITAAEDIYTADGTLRVGKDAVVEVIATDQEGIAETCDLYPGKYIISESRVPEGYIAQEPQVVEITGAGDMVHHVKIWNYQQKAQLLLHKEMEVSEQYGRGTMGEILSVRFGLYADEDIIAEDGSMISKGKLIEIASCSETGVVEFETMLPYGKYVIRERSTHEAYKLDPMPRPVEFVYQSDWPAEIEWDFAPDMPVYNTYKRGQIAGRKIDDTGIHVEGAVIGVYDVDETDFCRETALAIATSGANGTFRFDDVPYGTYIVREIEAPEGYVINEQSFVVEVEDEMEFAELQIINKYITGQFMLNKTDVSTGDPIPGCGIEIQDKSGKVLLQDITDENGNVAFYLGYGEYFYREYDAPEGYLLDEEQHPFTIQKDGQVIKAEMTNRMIEGLLVIEKLDGETGKPLELCGIEVLDESGNILQRQYTDERGLAMFSLLYGNYYYREFDAPEGYELDETARAFAIVEDQCVLTREMENFREKEVPKTGDSLQPLLPWLAGSAASAVLLLVIWKWKRRRS